MQSYALEKQIELETRALLRDAAECGKRADALHRRLDATRATLKELGDIANWVALLEQTAQDIDHLANTARDSRRERGQ